MINLSLPGYAQPQGGAKLDQSIARWPIGFSPGFGGPNYISNCGWGSPGTIRSPATPIYEFVPGYNATGYRINAANDIQWDPTLTQDADDFTVFWAGIYRGNTKMWGRGEDGFGNGWSLGWQFITGTTATTTWVDSSPAGFTMNITLPAFTVVTDKVAFAVTRQGATFTNYWAKDRSVTTQTSGNGGLRSSTKGFLLGRNNGGSSIDATPVFFAVADRALPVATIWAILDNPWIAFEPEPQYWPYSLPAAGGGRTTKNTRSWPLGTEIGMGWRMNL